MFHLVSCIPQNEMVVFAGDMNGYIGRINVGYDGTHGGLGTALRMLMVPGYWSLQMGNTLFTKQESKLVAYNNNKQICTAP